jgi:hypothetical protein
VVVAIGPPQTRFPLAIVRSSDAFDDFIADVLPVKASLPLVTAGE